MVAASAPPLFGQSRSAQYLTSARNYVSANQLDSAEVVLTAALADAPYTMDSVSALVWLAIVSHLKGDDSIARLRIRQALTLHAPTSVRGLEQISPGLADLFDSESRAMRIVSASALDEQPAWRAGPAVVYPPALRRRGVSGAAVVRAVVDTLGRVEPQSIEVIEAPDSALRAPLQEMMRATTFTPGRIRGRPMRAYANISLMLTPPPRLGALQLIRLGRDHLAARRADSALTYLTEALDSATGATPAERVYGQLLQGVAAQRVQRDSLASAAFEQGLAGYRELTARGVDLAPFLKRLADSIRISRRGAPRVATPLAGPTTVGAVGEQPTLVSHPPIRYAPEMQALRIGGTVIVEATLDTTGRVVPATVKVVQSPNPMFDAEARRVVLGALYRPARIDGRVARVTIRQAITFAPY